MGAARGAHLGDGLLAAIAVAYTVSFAAVTVTINARGSHGQAPPLRPMFVFRSSYVDTGNVKNPDTAWPYPWSRPYGQTWPGSPSGRYSNGRVLTDLLASSLNHQSPTSFTKRSTGNGSNMKAGLNFAIGGSGVLSAYGFPSISSQIDEFQTVASSYAPQELASAAVLYATAGDDYLYYLTVQNASLSDIYPLTVSVGKQLSNDLVRLYQLGLRKFAVTYVPPFGCLPVATASTSFTRCNDSWSTNVAQPHNARIFKNVLGNLKPCCIGSVASAKCSSLDATGQPAYSLCENPEAQFYWDDMIHPTEAGWQAVLKEILPSLRPLMK